MKVFSFLGELVELMTQSDRSTLGKQDVKAFGKLLYWSSKLANKNHKENHYEDLILNISKLGLRVAETFEFDGTENGEAGDKGN